MIPAVIPARGGSRRIPCKNLCQVGGKSLVRLAVETALQGCSPVYVSSDDARILEEAEGAGGVGVRRPPDLSGDTVSSERVIQHVIEDRIRKECRDVEGIAFVQCTVPLLRADTLRRVVDLYRSNKGTKCSVITVSDDFGYYGTIDAFDCYRPFRTVRERSQDMQPWVRDNGAVYLSREEVFMAGHRYADPIFAVHMPRWESIDIDDPIDLELCRMLWQLRLRRESGDLT